MQRELVWQDPEAIVISWGRPPLIVFLYAGTCVFVYLASEELFTVHTTLFLHVNC